MGYNYSKWNKYDIGKISWINNRKRHISRSKYIEHTLNFDFNNILEIGAGEVIEAQEIRNQRPDINYTVLDVSDVFLKNAKKLGFKTVKGEMHKTGFKDKEFDLIYLSAVLEHSPDIYETIKELARVGHNFYFTITHIVPRS